MIPGIVASNHRAVVDAARAARLTYLGVFGSQSRGDQTQSSDVDFLFDYHSDAIPSLFTLGTLHTQLVNLLGTEVDLVSKRALNPHLKSYILSDLQTVYEEK